MPIRCRSANFVIRKIPWKLSRPQKARHRRRMQHVDRVVDVLDTALKSQHRAQLTAATSASPTSTTSPSSSVPSQFQGLSPADLSLTAEGTRLLAQERDKAILARRSGRGPKRGEILPNFDADMAIDGTQAGETNRLRLVADQARELGTFGLLERWKAEMPTEGEMLPKDKYTIFDRKARGYRKGIHSEFYVVRHRTIESFVNADCKTELPKWTRVSQRLNPPGF